MAEEQEQSATTSGSGRNWFWPAFIVALLAAQVVLMLVLLYVANRDPTFAVEPGWYEKAIKWDDTAAQRRANQELGWSLAIDIGDIPGPLGKRAFGCKVTNRHGQPVEGAEVMVTAFPHHRASDRTHLELTAGPEGRYATRTMFRRTGLWEFRVVVRRGEETFTYVEQRDVLPPGRRRP